VVSSLLPYTTLFRSYTVTVHQIVNFNPDVTTATGYTYDGVNGWTPTGCCPYNIPLAQADISLPVDTKDVDKTVGFKQWDVTALRSEEHTSELQSPDH